ncbi:MAG: YciI family protein [Actinomycetota bacterium]|nr:YciI family protein [Actinomycetota bacterium]
MKYALLIYDTNEAWEQLSEEERQATYGEYFAVAQAPGVVGGAQLRPVDTATTVRVDNGQVLTTDGPFPETKEFFGGYYVVDADDLDAALELAARIPAARMGGAVEVRPIVER